MINEMLNSTSEMINRTKLTLQKTNKKEPN